MKTSMMLQINNSYLDMSSKLLNILTSFFFCQPILTALHTNSTAKAQSSDVCFRCHKQGHWTIDCLERHEPEYLAKQNCYLCVKKGNFIVACPNKIKTDDQFKTKRKQIKPPVVKSACYQTSTSLAKLFGNLSLKSLDDFEFYKSISSENSSNYDSKFHKQRTAEWFNAHKGKISGRKAAEALGWYG